MTIKEIIKLSGGAKAIADAIDGLKPDAVYKWPSIGIPDRHWPVIISLAPDITPQVLFEANVQARSAETAGAA